MLAVVAIEVALLQPISYTEFILPLQCSQWTYRCPFVTPVCSMLVSASLSMRLLVPVAAERTSF